MRTVYIDRKNAELTAESGALVVRIPGERPTSLPLAAIERLVVRGAATLSTGLLGELWRQDAGVLVLSGRRSEPTARLLGRPHADAGLRLAQYALQADRERRAALARRLLLGKLQGQRRVLARALETRPDRRRPLLRAVRGIAEIEAALDAAVSGDLPRLLGLEGAAAAAYFQGFATLFAPALAFTARNRRPPRDPVNAALSLGYTLLHFEAARQCQIVGLDVQLGILHEPAPGRDALACDLVEPVRAHVDQLVLELFAGGELRPEHFRQDASGCLMGKAGRERFYAGYERRAAGLARLLRLLARSVAREIRAAGETAR
ncbi:CRISPR-associated endonuclease Cas1 [Benzoatithermus flavus]|uniref:CRISPR-associated endonuclease Cas1 n=1 Tax=Benzoatithermus flavus TaxID=3108223 RepID=A0ABU8XY92_9PROT